MKTEEIFKISVDVMKRLLDKEAMSASLSRTKARNEEENSELLVRERENINELVRQIAFSEGLVDTLSGVSQDLIDAMVIRYLSNRDVFMRTFPDGIEGVPDEPFSIWAAIMISPRDEMSA
ncbi:MAG: hypothetical protein A2X59_03860 [Nitrospirae bacterium GWC2_42_7]|nr:MAG: hypothetical protein A2X59_03860 [Nitrospirae bacterium GWC2_42_7]